MTIWPTNPTGALDAGGAFVIGGGDFDFGQDYTENLIKDLFKISPTSGNALELLRDQMLKLPLEALEQFKDLIPGSTDPDFLDIGTAVETIINSLQENPVFMALADFEEFFSGAFSTVETIVNQIMDIFQGLLVTPINDAVQGVKDWWENLTSQIPGNDVMDAIFAALSGGTPTVPTPADLLAELTAALQSIPDRNVSGVGGPENIGDAIKATWDQWIGGLVGTPGTGAGLADLFNIGQLISSQAALGGFSWDILGIRNNKGFGSGMLSSSTSSIPYTQAATGAAPTTFALTASTAITLYERVQESALCGVVRWMGSGVTNVTGFYLNIYKMDTTTGDRVCVYTSGDIKADLSATMTTSKHVLSTPIQREPGEVYGYELSMTGTGTHTIVGEPSWVHPDPDVYPRKMSSVRNGGSVSVGTTQTSGTIVYGSNIPFIEIAVALDGVNIPHSPETVSFSTPGSRSIPIPSWANTVEVIALGGGGAGRQGGTYGVCGEGGDAGDWATTTWTRGTHFTGAPSISTLIGAAAIGGGRSGTSGGIGQNGADTVISITGHTLTATGGEGGDGLFAVGDPEKYGQSPGTITYGGQTYVGGGMQYNFGDNGAPPGGGGGGGNASTFGAGGYGGYPGFWIRFKQ